MKAITSVMLALAMTQMDTDQFGPVQGKRKAPTPKSIEYQMGKIASAEAKRQRKASKLK